MKTVELMVYEEDMRDKPDGVSVIDHLRDKLVSNGFMFHEDGTPVYGLRAYECTGGEHVTITQSIP